MPPAGQWTPVPAEVIRDQRAKLVDPATNGLAARHDAALQHQLFDIADAEGQAEIQPTACRIATGGNQYRSNEIGRIGVPWIGPVLGPKAETS